MVERKMLAAFKTVWDSRLVLSADLGQSQDPTAICVMEYLKGTQVTWKGRESPGGEQFLVRYLQRLPLGMSYVDQVRELGALLNRPPLNAGCDFVIDETGVGRPVGDLFNSLKLRPMRVVITGGENQSAHGSSRWHVPKGQLISALDARLHTGELKIAAELTEASALKEELRDFHRHISTAGRYSYDARVGRHDDLVLAVALALWNFVGRTKHPTAQISRATYIRE
jgi:hypothetical protein